METTTKNKKAKMEFSYTEKKELRKIYGYYQSLQMYDGDYKNFETKEELEAERKEAIAEYEKKFPELKKANVSIHDLPELVYSANQLKFIEDAQEQGMELEYSYSGRCMYGDVCPAVRCDSINDFTTKSIKRMDSMGLGIIIYAES